MHACVSRARATEGGAEGVLWRLGVRGSGVVSGSSGRGPVPGALCTVCRSPMLGFIDAGITSGSTLRSIANQTGVSYAALKRHAANHVVVASPSASPTARLGPGASSLDAMRQTLDDLIATDLSTLSARGKAAHAEAIRRVAETLARMEPPETLEVARVEDVEGLPEFLGDLFLLGEKHPAIRADIGALFRKHGLIPTPTEAT